MYDITHEYQGVTMAGSLTSSLVSMASSLYLIFAALIGFSILVGVHEFGHFIFAKLAHIDTPSFSIGFGPTLIHKQIGGTDFKLSAIPLGGYVEIAGMAEVGQGDQAEAARTDDRSFGSKPYYLKLLVLLGGIMFNLLFAYLAFIFLMLFGMPQSPMMQGITGTTVINTIEPNSPAQRAGLMAGDQIISLGDTLLENDFVKLYTKLQENAGKDIAVKFMRNCTEQTATIAFDKELSSPFHKRMGVVFKQKTAPEGNFIDKITYGITTTNKLIVQTIQGFISIFKRRSTEGLGGPLSILAIMSQSAKEGFGMWLLLLIIISVNLAILNLLPLPILDGGQVLLYTIEALIGRSLPQNIKMGIHYASWLLMLLLILWLTFKDIKVLAYLQK
jgi:regulator of sigma E protease